MVLERVSPLKLKDVELVLRRAVWRRKATISAVEPAGVATVYSILQPELYGKLLAADVRFAAFLPCRIVAYEQKGGTRLAAISPVEFARIFHRPDLEEAAAAVENLLQEVLSDAGRPIAMAAGEGGHAESALGATEDQMNMRGTVPPRIDSRGSKVEELAGTGEQDSQGG
ncbi:MAG TPA: DUF302 domain-containing protein [Bryobacteraceae bacterium]|nr:DUF302 domain-containing protein [Bryobacteraceae bacterium]